MHPLALSLAAWTGSAGFLHLPASSFVQEMAGPQVLLVAEAASPKPFSEVIPSWNASWEGGTMKVELQPLYPDGASPRFDLGSWTLGETGRTSVKQEPLPEGRVETDTLVLSKPAERLRVILTLTASEGKRPQLKSFFLSLTSPGWSPAQEEANTAAWGKELPVPIKAQHDYPKGSVLCSPTSVSMLMNYGASLWQRPDLAKDVPDIQNAVFDPAWGGTGNWAFNMAYPGSFEGVTAYVARLSSLRQAEDLILAGIPIACSVDYKKLLQKDWEGDSGHLVVLIGFTPAGDPIINDPAKGPLVRQVYPRAAFSSAWASSKQTVYIISGPSTQWPPSEGPWPSSPSLSQSGETL